MSKNFTCFFPYGRGPIMSIPHCANGQGEEMVVIFSPGTRWTFPISTRMTTSILKVSLHLYLLYFEISLNLSYDELWIAPQQSIVNSKCLGYPQPRQYSLVLRFVVGHGKFKLDSIFQSIPLRGSNDDACSASLLREQHIRMYHPKFSLVIFTFRGGELCYKICQRLSFYGRSRSILYIELTELNGPLHHSSSSLRFIHCFLNGLVHHYYNRVSLKVRTKFSGGHY